MKLQMLTTKCCKSKNVIKKTLHKTKENNDAINTVIANKQQLEDDAQALSTKEAELKVAQLNLAAEKSSAENEKNALLQQKLKLKSGSGSGSSRSSLPCKTKGTTSSCESFCKYHTLQAQVQGSSTNTCCNTSGSTNICSSSTCCSNSSSSTSSNCFSSNL